MYIKKIKQTVPKPNAQLLRNFSKNAIVRTAINLVKEGVLKRPWRIVSIGDNEYKEYTDIVTKIINNPNKDDDYDSFFGAILEDSIVGDCMAFEKARAGGGRPLFLFPIDGMTIKMVVNNDNYKYAQEINGKDKYFTSDEIAYIKRVNRTDSPFGLGVLETAFNYINALTNTFEYSSEVASNALPKYVLNIGKEAGQKLEEYRIYFMNECMGENTVPIISSDGVQSAQISPISEDATFIKYQSFLIAIISYCFGVPAELLGIEKANDRSTSQDTYNELLEYGVKPYCRLIEKAINKHVIGELGLGKYIRFEFIYEQTLEEKQKMTDIVTKQFMSDLISINEARKMLNIPPSNNKYADYHISEMKARINDEIGMDGYNGVGNDRYDDKVTDNKLNQ